MDYRIDFLPNRREGEYLPDRLADETISFIKQQKEKGRPLFTALFNYTVHWPMEAPEELVKKYKDRPLKGYNDHRYAAMIEAMDAAIGRVLESLDEIGVAEETLVVPRIWQRISPSGSARCGSASMTGCASPARICRSPASGRHPGSIPGRFLSDSWSTRRSRIRINGPIPTNQTPQ